MLSSRSEILVEAISMHEISAWIDNSSFMDQICPKKLYPVKNRKIGHEFCIFQLD